MCTYEKTNGKAPCCTHQCDGCMWYEEDEIIRCGECMLFVRVIDDIGRCCGVGLCLESNYCEHAIRKSEGREELHG